MSRTDHHNGTACGRQASLCLALVTATLGFGPVSPGLAGSRGAETGGNSAPGGPETRQQDELRRYGDWTLAEWREHLKTLDPDSSASHAAVPGLIALIRDGSVPSFTRRQAASLLGRIGKPASDKAVPVLLDLLRNPAEPQGDSPREAGEPAPVWVIKALARFGPEAKAATPRLREILQDEKQPLSRRAVALQALAAIGTAHPEAVPAVMNVLQATPTDNDRATDGDETELRVLAAQSLQTIGAAAAPAVPTLMRIVQNSRESTQLRREALTALGAMGARAEVAVPTLMEIVVFGETPALRDKAADALAGVGEKALPALERLLRDRDAGVRWRAAWALGLIGRPAQPARDALKKALKDDDRQVRIHAVEALWNVTADAEFVIPPLLDALQHEDRQIRLRAVKLLAVMEQAAQPAVPRLKELQQDRRPYVRRTAAKALEEIGRAAKSHSLQ